MQDRRIDELIAKAAAGTLTDEEFAELTAWYNSFNDSHVVLPARDGVDVAQLKAQIYQRLMEQLRPSPPTHSKRPYILRLLPYAAAVLIVFLVVGLWYLGADRLAPREHTEMLAGDVAPGGNRATLTLADGRTLALSEEQEGIRVGAEVTYLDGSLVPESEMVSLTSDSVQQLVLATPNGGTYQVTLPDGTRVWLNAASTLKYPNRFTGETRTVELVGEAYFTVSKVTAAGSQDGEHIDIPFRVISNGHEIEVLGTEFNIAAYPTEPEIKTTLVSGKVKVKSAQESVILAANQQSIVGTRGIDVRTVETAPYIAWKNGRFHFSRTPLEEIMKQIARWYDVEVVYTQGIPHETFSGKVRRDVSLMGVLNILQVSTIDIKLQGKTLVIN